MSSYVPPHSRRAQQAPRNRRDYANEQSSRIQQEEQQKRANEEKKLENTEENFPILVSISKSSRWSTGTKTFAQLASEWSEKAKEEEISKQAEEAEQEIVNPRPRYHHTLPKFHNVHRFIEPEDDSSIEELPPVKEDDGWVTVKPKYRREKTIEEKFNRPLTPPENTVWNADEHPNEHETCWEDKRY